MTDELTEQTPRLLAPSELRYLVLAAQREGNRVFTRMLSQFGLTASQAEILVVLDEFGPMSLRDVGGMIVCEAGSPSRIVDILVVRGLLIRETDPTDRRAVMLQLTSRGRELVPQLRVIEDQMDLLTAKQLTSGQQEVVSGVLRGFLAGSASGDALERRFALKRIDH